MAEPAILQLVASAAQSANGEGAAFDAEKPGRSVSVTLAVTSASGSSRSLTVVLEHSQTGADTWTELGRFPAVTGATNASVSVGPAMRYLRARWEIADGSSFTFEVVARAYSFLITRQQFVDHIGGRIRLAFDDGNIGVPSERAVDRILADTTSMLRGKIGPVDDLGSFTPETQSEIVRVGLDIAHARACIRAPEVFKMDGQKLLDVARKDLKEIRVGGADVAPAAPPTVERPTIESLGAGLATPPRRWR